MAAPHQVEEYLDLLTKTGLKTGISKPRRRVHRDGDYHRAVHVWIFSESTHELLLQCRAGRNDAYLGMWDISCAGHVSAGESSLVAARRELQEELGLDLPKDSFELLYVFLSEYTSEDGKFINNEFDDVYLVTTMAPIPLETLTLQETAVSAVRYVHWEEYRSLLAKEDPEYVPHGANGLCHQFFDIIAQRYSGCNK